MFGLEILDVAIGLVFMYLLLSLACTALNEAVVALLDSRARTLHRGIRFLLRDESFDRLKQEHPHLERLEDEFYAHPLIRGLYEERLFFRGRKHPSYIPARTFALALLDVVAPVSPDGTRTVEDVRQALRNGPRASGIRRTLQVLLNDARGDLAVLEGNVEIWFDNAMDRVSAWYKRRTQLVVAIFALAFTLLVNADTIRIASTLSRDDALRDAVVAQAQEYARRPAAAPDTIAPEERVRETISELEGLGIPLGWEGDPLTGGVLAKVAGLLITALAVSLGAPFWFDVLNRFMTVRSAGRSPEEEPKDPAAEAKRLRARAPE